MKQQMIDPLFVQILEQQSKDLEFTTNALIDGYKHQAETAEATLAAIRDRVDRLFSGPYMPTPDSVLRALWPAEEIVNRYRKAEAS